MVSPGLYAAGSEASSADEGVAKVSQAPAPGPAEHRHTGAQAARDPGSARPVLRPPSLLPQPQHGRQRSHDTRPTATRIPAAAVSESLAQEATAGARAGAARY